MIICFGVKRSEWNKIKDIEELKVILEGTYGQTTETGCRREVRADDDFLMFDWKFDGFVKEYFAKLKRLLKKYKVDYSKEHLYMDEEDALY